MEVIIIGSFILGSIFSGAGVILYWNLIEKGSFFINHGCIFFMSLTLQHFLEVLMTASNHGRVDSEDFLLDQMYVCGIISSLVEYWMGEYFGWKNKYFIGKGMFYLGLAGIFVGQGIRTLAMYNCGRGFSHHIEEDPKTQSKMVKTGIYSYMRHPGYCGWFLLSVSQQLILQNYIHGIVFTGILWIFFRERIRYEEQVLVDSYGDEYIDYRKEVPWSGIWYVT